MNTKKAAFTVLSIALKIVIFAVLVLVVVRVGSFAYEYGHAVFEEEALDEPPGRTIPVTVPEGASAKDIAMLLEDEGLVEDWKLFCRRWLLHENPYTGMVWGRDPALIQVSLVNEGNLDFFWNTTAETERLYRKRFSRWMAERYPAESATASRSEPRFLQFLNELQRNALLEQKRFLREELKVEVCCLRSRLSETLAAVRAAHPYQEPVVNVLPLLATGLDMEREIT